MTAENKTKNTNNEDRLIVDLFTGYNPSARPVVDEKDPVLINISLILLQIVDLVSVIYTNLIIRSIIHTFTH